MNPKQVRWLKELACYDFAIKYIKIKINVGADVLSRKPDYKNLNKLKANVNQKRQLYANN